MAAPLEETQGVGCRAKSREQGDGRINGCLDHTPVILDQCHPGPAKLRGCDLNGGLSDGAGVYDPTLRQSRRTAPFA